MDEARFATSLPIAPEANRRRRRIAAITLLIAGPAVLTAADLHWRTGYDGWKLIHLVLFIPLIVLVSLGAAQALVGFGLRRRGGDPCRINVSLGPDDEAGAIPAPTAVVMPICNEDVHRVIASVRTIYQSVERAGCLRECHFFLLSDSTDPNCWIAEEAAWLALTHQLGADQRLFYRRRRIRINKKAGNLADFCRRWGGHYRYMVVLDADSMITGGAVARLVRLMEQNPRVGIIQGMPTLVNGETILARLQQFASRLYGPVAAAGLNYWQLSEANYWGHNAIVRLAPFIRHCSLPDLPGRGPFGGRILSHDFVEAALMRRAGWEVWLATDLKGNYEECPATVIELARRDRRWLQGNLQHARLVFAQGLHGANRAHFVLGILAYVSSPLWFVFLVVSAVIAAKATSIGTGPAAPGGSSAFLHWSTGVQAFTLFAYTIAVLLLPKALALVDLRGRPEELAQFGGSRMLIAGAAFETLLFTLLAPVLMLFHTWFILLTLMGKNAPWRDGVRSRGAEFRNFEPLIANGGQTVIGILGALAAGWAGSGLDFWMAPIFAGLILSIPFSYLTGSRLLGRALRERGIFQTPEENHPPLELAQLAAAPELRPVAFPPHPDLLPDYGLLQAVLDPYVNAVHVSFLRPKGSPQPGVEARFAALRSRLLREGPRALTPRERLTLLMDADSMRILHYELWATPASHLAEWWRLALQHFNRIAPAPQTAFNRC